MLFWSPRWPKLKWRSTQTLIMLCASCWVTVLKKNGSLQVSASCHFSKYVVVCNGLKCAPWCFIQVTSTTLFHLGPEKIFCTFTGNVGPGFPGPLETTVMLYLQMENHFPWAVALKGLVFFFSHVSAHHISCMNIRTWRNLTLACADMELVTQMTVATSTSMVLTQEKWVFVYVRVCLPLSTA